MKDDDSMGSNCPSLYSWGCGPKIQGIKMTKHSPSFTFCLVMETYGTSGWYFLQFLPERIRCGGVRMLPRALVKCDGLQGFVCRCVDSDGRSLDLSIADRTTAGSVPQGAKAPTSRELR